LEEARGVRGHAAQVHAVVESRGRTTNLRMLTALKPRLVPSRTTWSR
jgi:hypothetical protein